MNMDLNTDGVVSPEKRKLEESDTDSDTKDAVDQVYSYMAELGLQYGVLSTYNNHWFLYRLKDNPTELRKNDTKKLIMMMGDIKSQKVLGDVTNGHLEEMNMDLNTDGVVSRKLEELDTDSNTSTTPSKRRNITMYHKI
ncbi:hypothetical protein C2G38_2248275 [Gigaspora rosea]|uniref:Uncharacterized protein n=1 Tax=Gigaspora rosea TaxID=44941 RepID=A0A397UXR3_9GLOM|nr:hypothetical protein C2G38_2248275 [Gigaspora rosea]CAG8459440.1 18394_t:CDS:2 [Gigaspora rosea]